MDGSLYVLTLHVIRDSPALPTADHAMPDEEGLLVFGMMPVWFAARLVRLGLVGLVWSVTTLHHANSGNMVPQKRTPTFFHQHFCFINAECDYLFAGEIGCCVSHS